MVKSQWLSAKSPLRSRLAPDCPELAPPPAPGGVAHAYRLPPGSRGAPHRSTGAVRRSQAAAVLGAAPLRSTTCGESLVGSVDGSLVNPSIVGGYFGGKILDGADGGDVGAGGGEGGE